MIPLFETNPDFINTEGTKWWIEKCSTQYAHDSKGIYLDVQVWLVETIDGYRTYVIIDKQKACIIYSSQLLESIGVYIDILKADKVWSKNE
ncbi:MAG: hypothetical protein E6R13_01120 [Spirochaetes bacterium]|nr:MAG: hypothetical protein E6R13_01120 [Spirochaetota bacterium]